MDHPSKRVLHQDDSTSLSRRCVASRTFLFPFPPLIFEHTLLFLLTFILFFECTLSFFTHPHSFLSTLLPFLITVIPFKPHFFPNVKMALNPFITDLLFLNALFSFFRRNVPLFDPQSFTFWCILFPFLDSIHFTLFILSLFSPLLSFLSGFFLFSILSPFFLSSPAFIQKCNLSFFLFHFSFNFLSRCFSL